MAAGGTGTRQRTGPSGLPLHTSGHEGACRDDASAQLSRCCAAGTSPLMAAALGLHRMLLHGSKGAQHLGLSRERLALEQAKVSCEAGRAAAAPQQLLQGCGTTSGGGGISSGGSSSSGPAAIQHRQHPVQRQWICAPRRVLRRCRRRGRDALQLCLSKLQAAFALQPPCCSASMGQANALPAWRCSCNEHAASAFCVLPVAGYHGF